MTPLTPRFYVDKEEFRVRLYGGEFLTPANIDCEKWAVNTRGFHIYFHNGLILSTMFSADHICENDGDLEQIEMANHNLYPCPLTCNDCEVAVIDSQTGYWLTRKIFQKIFKKTKRTLSDDITGGVDVLLWESFFRETGKYKMEETYA